MPCSLRCRSALHDIPRQGYICRTAPPDHPSQLILRSLALLGRTESLELHPSLLQVVIDDNSVVNTWCLRVSNLVLGLLQAGQNRLFAIRRAPA